MKNIPPFAISIFLLFYSCQNSCTENLIEHRIQLNNGIGELTICLSPEFDTLMFFSGGNDYPCGSYQFYGIQPKAFQPHQSFSYMGFNNQFPDSEYCFTISHKTYRECDFEYGKMNFDSLYQARVEQAKQIDPSYIVPPDSIIKINGLDCIVGYRIDTLESRIKTYSVGCETYFNHSLILIAFTKKTLSYKKDQDFVKESFAMLSTMRLR